MSADTEVISARCRQRCPKCEGRDICTAWHRGRKGILTNCEEDVSFAEECSGPVGEHLRRECRGCGYFWFERPRDFKRRAA